MHKKGEHLVQYLEDPDTLNKRSLVFLLAG